MIRRIGVGLFGILLLAFAFTSQKAPAQTTPTTSAGACAWIVNQCYVVGQTTYYDNFSGDAVGTAPPGWSTTVLGNSVVAAPFAVSTASAIPQFVESAGTHNDIAWYTKLGVLKSMWAQLTFTYENSTTFPAMCLVYSTGYPGGGPIQCLRVNTSPSGNSSAGQVSLLYYQSGAASTTYQSQAGNGDSALRARPYTYQVGHTYTMTMVVDPTTSIISLSVYDSANPGQPCFGTYFTNAVAATFSGYPGWENLGTSGQVAINSFAAGPFGTQPQIPVTPARAYSFVHGAFVNQNNTLAATPPPSCSAALSTSAAIQGCLAPLHIYAIRASDDTDDTVTLNYIYTTYGIETIALTSLGDAVTVPRNFCNTIGACLGIDGPNEPGTANSAYATQSANILADFPNYTVTPQWLAGPSFLPDGSAEPTVMASMQPYYISAGNPLTYVDSHPYTLYNPETPGFGAYVSTGCGASPFTLPCGTYGAVQWNDLESQTLVPGLPVINSEGGASYGSYPNICGSSNADMYGQMSFILRGMLYLFKVGHPYFGTYKMVDDGGCTDTYGTYGLMNRIRDTSGNVVNINPKPSYVAILGMMSLLDDKGATAQTFTVAPISCAIGGYNSYTESLWLAWSDGTYRLMLWQDDNSPWNFNKVNGVVIGSVPLNPVNLTVSCKSQVSATTYQINNPANGAYVSNGTQTNTVINVTANEYPTVMDIVPSGVTATPAPLPSPMPTPGPTETPT